MDREGLDRDKQSKPNWPTRRRSEPEPAGWLAYKSSGSGGWLWSLTYVFGKVR